MKDKYIILGAGGHAKIVLDILQLNEKDIVGLTDAACEKGSNCMGYPVLGTDDILGDLYQQGAGNAVMGIGHIGNSGIRDRLYKKAKEIGYNFPNVIHSKAYLAATVEMGEGNLLAAQCVINPDVVIGNLCIINTASVVEHDVIIGDGVHIAPHATVLGGGQIGNGTFIGAGSVILQGVCIGSNCVIGAGSVVRKDVENNCVIVGNPGRVLKRRL